MFFHEWIKVLVAVHSHIGNDCGDITNTSV